MKLRHPFAYVKSFPNTLPLRASTLIAQVVRTHVIANQRRNAGVAIRNPCLPLGVVLRAANQNLTIASGNCTIMYRWHGAAVTDEGKEYFPALKTSVRICRELSQNSKVPK